MNDSCGIIQDLLPLYHDGACSAQSRKIVEEHLLACDACKSMMEKIQNHACDDRFQEEKERIIGHYKQGVKRRLLLVGFCIAAAFLFVCLIVNLATGKTLDWFFIVLTSLAVFASFTAVPLIARERKRLWTLGGFAASVNLLLLTCCLYSDGDWFFVACFGTLLGLSVLFLPAAIGQLPLKGFALRNKSLLVMAVDTILLYALIIACGFYGDPADYWSNAMLITTVTVFFAWGLFVVIRYFRVNKLIKSGICMMAGGLFFSLIYDVIHWIVEGVVHISFSDANLQVWNTDAMINANAYLLILLSGCTLGFILLLLGGIRQRKQEAEKRRDS